LPHGHPSQSCGLHGDIPEFPDLIPLQLRQRILITSAAAGLEAIPDRVTASGQKLEKST
jgi:hypothetical protein